MEGLTKRGIDAIVATSGNVSGEPICVDDAEAKPGHRDAGDQPLLLGEPLDQSGNGHT